MSMPSFSLRVSLLNEKGQRFILYGFPCRWPFMAVLRGPLLTDRSQIGHQKAKRLASFVV